MNPQNPVRGLTVFKTVEPSGLLIASAIRRIVTAQVISAILWTSVQTVQKKSLKVDRNQFEGIVKSLLQTKPLKREDVKVSKRKPGKLIPPQKPEITP